MKVKEREWKSWLKTQHSKNKDYGIRPHHFMANRWGNSGNSDRLYFLGLQNRCRWWLQPWNEKMFASWKKSYDEPRQHIKRQGHYFANKGPSSQSYGFSSSQVWMWELDLKEDWAMKNWWFWTVVLEKTLESPLDCKEIKPVNPKENQPWIFIGRTDAEAENPVLWPPDAKNWLIWKDPDSGKDWGQEEKGTTEDEMASPTQWTWVWVNSGSCWWTGRLGVLQFMGLQLNTTERLNWTELNNKQCWASFHVFVSHLYVFFGQMSL